MSPDPTPIPLEDEPEALSQEEILEAAAAGRPPSQSSTVQDQIISTTALVTELAKTYKIKPELVTRIAEIVLQYTLARTQIQMNSVQPPVSGPPYEE